MQCDTGSLYSTAASCCSPQLPVWTDRQARRQTDGQIKYKTILILIRSRCLIDMSTECTRNQKWNVLKRAIDNFNLIFSIFSIVILYLAQSKR